MKTEDIFDDSDIDTVMPDDEELLRRADAPDDEFIDSEELHKAIAFVREERLKSGNCPDCGKPEHTIHA